MKILFLTPQFPYPPLQGTSLRNYHIICGLAEGDELSLLSFDEQPPTTAAARAHLQTLCRNIWTVPAPQRSTAQRLRQLLTSRQPDVALRLADAAFDQALAQVLRHHRFDVVQIEGIELARTIPAVRRLSPWSSIVFDNHNAETALQQRALLTDLRTPRRWLAAAYSAVQIGRLRRFERWACQAADWVVVVSERDRTAIRHLLRGQQKPLTVIPNSVNVAQYDPARLAAEALPRSFDLLFTGKMDYRPNVDAVCWFANAVWPHIRAQRPQASWAIVGQKPDGRVAQLGQREGITVTGRVEEVLPYLAAAALYIVPLRMGSGTRLKLLEAMAAAKAIVSTTVGVEGFAVQSGNEVVLADTAEEMAAAILTLLADQGERERLGAAAQRFAAGYDWRRIVPLFRLVYNQ
jgi:glycosyltransferase involved in cell wall biosynthesis